MFADQGFAGWAGRVPLLIWDSTLVTCPLVLTLTNRASGPRFRKHRRFINQVFNQKGISTFRPLQEKEILVLLEGMLHHPDDFVDHFRRFATIAFKLDRQTYEFHRYAAATILKITYGYDILSVDDLFVRLGWSLPCFWVNLHLEPPFRSGTCWNFDSGIGVPCCQLGRFFPPLKVR